MRSYNELRVRYLAAMGVLLGCAGEDRPAESARVVIPADVGDASAVFNPPPTVTDASAIRADPPDTSVPVVRDEPDATLPPAVVAVRPPAVKSSWTAVIPGRVAPMSYCPTAIPRAECRVFVDPHVKLCTPGSVCTAANRSADALGCPATLSLPLPCSPISVGGCGGNTFAGPLMVDITSRERPAHAGGCCYEGPAPPCGAPWMGRALVDGDRVVLPSHADDELARMAAMEWASVASFARSSLELMSLGAPADLIRETHQAALDEIEHARLLSHHPIFAVPTLAPRTMTFALLARTTFLEACVGETLGAVQARIRAEDWPDLREAMLRIASDEERHAELAWKILAWAVSMGGAQGLREALAVARPTELEDVYVAVVVPCAQALLSLSRDA